MTTLVKRSGLVLGAVALVAATAAATTVVIGSSARASAKTSSSSSSAQSSQRYREVTLPAGTRLQLRLGSGYSSEMSHVEQRVDATIVSTVRANGVTALPAGSRVSGVVSSLERPGKVKGRGRIGLRFTDVVVDGERYPIAASYVRVAPARRSSCRRAAKMPTSAAAR